MFTQFSTKRNAIGWLIWPYDIFSTIYNGETSSPTYARTHLLIKLMYPQIRYLPCDLWEPCSLLYRACWLCTHNLAHYCTGLADYVHNIWLKQTYNTRTHREIVLNQTENSSKSVGKCSINRRDNNFVNIFHHCKLLLLIYTDTWSSVFKPHCKLHHLGR